MRGIGEDETPDALLLRAVLDVRRTLGYLHSRYCELTMKVTQV